MITKQTLEDLYIANQLSVSTIAKQLSCSQGSVNYWLAKHGIEKRSISDAIYIKHNPLGDPFTIPSINTIDKARLYGLGIGLYWGEGTKANKHSVRLGNSDPELLRVFIRFLVELYGVKKEDMRFGLQLFSDIDKDEALGFWCQKLGVSQKQFYKPYVSISGSLGTYRAKSTYGVVTLYYHNKRLRDTIASALPKTTLSQEYKS